MSGLKIFQKGWNFRQDGPGNRLVYHLQGCNLHCPWCSNPEGMEPGGTLIVKEFKLIAEVCPHGAVRGSVLDRGVCSVCKFKECVTVNLNEGIRLSCADYPVSALAEEVRASKHLFHGGGGVTLSGGEPTVQFDGIKEFLGLLKADGINTAIETNGTHPKLPELFPLLDVLIVDLKHYDSAKMKASVGLGNTVCLENISMAARLHGNVWLRITLVPGFNDSLQDIEQYVSLFRRLPRENISLELISHHEYGKVKWRQCGMEYEMKAAEKMPDIAEYENLFRHAGMKVIRT